MLSPECETNFRASPSYWAAIINSKGEPFQTPKSCVPCRKHARQQNISSMVTSMPADVPPDPVSMESPESTANWWSAAMVAGCTENADDYFLTENAENAADIGFCDDYFLANLYDDYDLTMSEV